MWIPKPDTTPGPNALRPLQLPTCMQSLFGALIMSLARPYVEPRITNDQAAKTRGDYGQNITAVFRHLES